MQGYDQTNGHQIFWKFGHKYADLLCLKTIEYFVGVASLIWMPHPLLKIVQKLMGPCMCIGVYFGKTKVHENRKIHEWFIPIMIRFIYSIAGTLILVNQKVFRCFYFEIAPL